MSEIRALTMPKWGIEMQEGTVTGWHKQAGDTVAEGEELIDIETDKIVNTVESPFTGVLRRTLAEEGEIRRVGELLGVFAPESVDDAALDAFIASFVPADTSFEPEDPSAGAAKAPPSEARGRPASGAPAAPVSISPIARKVAERLGVDLAGVQGTGRNGRISKEDVEAAARAQGLLAAEEPEGRKPAFEVIRLSGTQRTGARRLQEAKQQIPHFYLQADVQASMLKKLAAKADVSINTAIVQAMGMALEAVPEANVQYVDDALHRYHQVDLGVAVSTPRGLVVPILRDVAGRSLDELHAAARGLAERARDRKLTMEDVEGGTSTVSNLGMFGVDRFTAIVNPPQASILAVGAMTNRPVVDEDDDDDVEVRPMISVTLSCDHRAIDGALGAQLLAAFRAAVESGLERTA